MEDIEELKTTINRLERRYSILSQRNNEEMALAHSEIKKLSSEVKTLTLKNELMSQKLRGMGLKA